MWLHLENLEVLASWVLGDTSAVGVDMVDEGAGPAVATVVGGLLFQLKYEGLYGGSHNKVPS